MRSACVAQTPIFAVTPRIASRSVSASAACRARKSSVPETRITECPCDACHATRRIASGKKVSFEKKAHAPEHFANALCCRELTARLRAARAAIALPQAIASNFRPESRLRREAPQQIAARAKAAAAACHRYRKTPQRETHPFREGDTPSELSMCATGFMPFSSPKLLRPPFSRPPLAQRFPLMNCQPSTKTGIARTKQNTAVAEVNATAPLRIAVCISGVSPPISATGPRVSASSSPR